MVQETHEPDESFRPGRQQESTAPRLKRSKALVTRVVDDLMVFVKVEDEDEGALGLVFKPNKIDNYDGRPLRDVGIHVGAILPTIIWNVDTLLVQSVRVNHQTGYEPMAMRMA
jgi:hypothetical protein